jgi:hypothetical protein
MRPRRAEPDPGASSVAHHTTAAQIDHAALKKIRSRAGAGNPTRPQASPSSSRADAGTASLPLLRAGAAAAAASRFGIGTRRGERRVVVRPRQPPLPLLSAPAYLRPAPALLPAPHDELIPSRSRVVAAAATRSRRGRADGGGGGGGRRREGRQPRGLVPRRGARQPSPPPHGYVPQPALSIYPLAVSLAAGGARDFGVVGRSCVRGCDCCGRSAWAGVGFRPGFVSRVRACCVF